MGTNSCPNIAARRALERTDVIGLTGEFHRVRIRERAFGTGPPRCGSESREHTDHPDRERSSHAVPFRTEKAPPRATAHLAIGANMVRMREGFGSPHRAGIDRVAHARDAEEIRPMRTGERLTKTGHESARSLSHRSPAILPL